MGAAPEDVADEMGELLSEIQDVPVQNALTAAIDDVEIVLPLELLRYYPDQSFDEQQQLVLKLHLRKRGGLSIDL